MLQLPSYVDVQTYFLKMDTAVRRLHQADQRAANSFINRRRELSRVPGHSIDTAKRRSHIFSSETTPRIQQVDAKIIPFILHRFSVHN